MAMIKNVIKMAAVCICLGVATYDASAVIINDTKTIGVALSPASPTYSSATAGTSFDLTTQGVPSTSTVLWAHVSFTLLNLDGQVDVVTATFGSQQLYGVSSLVGFSAFGDMVNGTVVGALNSTGTLDYTVSYVGSVPGFAASSVILSQAALVADVARNARVPDAGATLLLMGLAVATLGLGKRKNA